MTHVADVILVLEAPVAHGYCPDCVSPEEWPDVNGSRYTLTPFRKVPFDLRFVLLVRLPHCSLPATYYLMIRLFLHFLSSFS